METRARNYSKDPVPFNAAVIRRRGRSSKKAVENNDDLLIEILLWLPVISLLRLKSVCKRWSSLISDPTFTLRKSLIPTLDPACGLLITHYVGICSSGYKHCLLSLDARIPCKISALNKNPFTFGSHEILDSCNGLLLLCSSNTHATACKYYVYNPCINLIKTLPQCSTKMVRHGVSGTRIAFDPTKSPHYKVICAVDVKQGAGIYLNIQIETYSSETDMWTVSSGGYMQPSFVGFGEDGIYWNDALYWLNNLYNQDVLLIKLDISVEDQELTTIEYPRQTLEGDLYGRDVKLFETCGCLLILCREDGNPLLMDVYEMKKGYSEWLVKYHVDLNDDVLCPRRSWTDPIVYSILLGEREEDSFIVVEDSEKILQYKLVLKTSRHLYDLKSAYQTSHDLYDLTLAYHIRSFPFIASFAGVGL